MVSELRFRLSDTARSAVEIYVLDPAHDADADECAFALQGRYLFVSGNFDDARDRLHEASNSADDDGDRMASDALMRIAMRCR